MPIKTYGTDSALREQRKAIHAYWWAHPEATGKQAAAALGVSVYTAMSNRPHGLPPADRGGDHKRGIRPDAANAEATISAASGQTPRTPKRLGCTSWTTRWQRSQSGRGGASPPRGDSCARTRRPTHDQASIKSL